MMKNEKVTLCLNMIVKNEAHIIKKTLENVLKAFNIDYWVIQDTGSTDGTQEVIKKTLAHIPGKLFEKEWINFGANRQAALKSAEGLTSHALFIDADQDFEGKCPKFDNDADAVFLNVKRGPSIYPLKLIVRNNGSWCWRGVVHEGLYEIGEPKVRNVIGPLKGLTVINERGGARSKDNFTYVRDAKLLKKAIHEIEKDSNSMDKDLLPRYQFYLANSLRDAGLFNEAIVHYDKRISLNGWNEEVYVSKIEKAICLLNVNKREQAIISLLSAGSDLKTRSEHFYHLARFYNSNGNPKIAHAYAVLGLKIPKPETGLFVSEDIYDFWLSYELAVSAKKMNDRDLFKKYKDDLIERLKGRHPHLIQILDN